LGRYSFVTRWHIRAPIEAVFEELLHVERWPRWWDGVEEATEVEPGDPDRVGSVWEYSWKSVLPYTLRFRMRTTRVEVPVAIDGAATGELAGEGLWRLFREGDGTLVRYEWNVATTGRWMNLLAPIARPVFAWNHDVVMRQGGEGLAARLQGRHRTDPAAASYGSN